jgi:uncharacterized protein (TIRG00374 family)
LLSRGRVLGLLLTVVFLFLALRQVDPAELAAEFAQVNYVWLVPSALCTLVGYLLRTVRWRVILSGAAQAPLGTLFPVLIMGFATNNLLPGRLGEFWRAFLLGRKAGVRRTTGLASVFVERIFDGLVLVALLAVVSRTVQLPEWGQQVQVVSAFVFVGATVAIATLLWAQNFAQRVVRWLARRLPARLATRVEGMFEGFLEGLRPLHQPSVLLGATALSLGVWLAEGASYYLISRGISLGLAPGLDFSAMGLTLVSINLGIMIPSSPGYVGALEFFGTEALKVFGVDHATALALVIVSHVVQYALVTGMGLVFFAREHLSPTALGRLQAETEPAA